MADHFTTEFGHRIDFVPGWYDAIRTGFLASIDDDQFAKQERGTVTPGPNWTPERSYQNSYLKSLVSFSHFAWFLERWGRLRTWNNAIDLGGAYGTFSALLKASGLASHVTSVDLLDYSATAPDFQHFVDNLESIAAEGTKRIGMAKSVFDLFPGESLLAGLFKSYPQPAVIDEQKHQDFFEVGGTYDLVTSIAVIDLFDLDVSLAKVRDLLSQNGLFVCVEEYPWWAMSSACIFGHFPYVAQRLTGGDLRRYIEQHHPDMVPSLAARCNYLYAGKMPTLTDFVLAAARQGLRLVAMERTQAKRHHRLPFSMPQMLNKPWFNIAEVMRDIRHIRPDASVDDLTTSIVTLAMTRA